MGGKHKQANRTKNNTRPSSSSHSAELLGNTIPTLFGLPVAKDGGSVLSNFVSEEIGYNIDSNFQIVLKKMNKKDATTKLKALQEFTELCTNSEPDAVKTILPFWPRLYCILCTDVEHRVREAAHNAHRAVISKVKRSIAPYLKQIAGPWFTSQYDTYPPAATAATLAFQEAFSPTKLNEAIIFCQEEILNYIYDNLINQTPQTLSNPKTTSAEEMEAKYQRVIVASLQGFSLYLQKLSFEQIKQAEGNCKKLISNTKFWKYAKHKTPLIRNSFFNMLISLCHNAKFLLDGELSHVMSAVFNNLDESDPLVLPTVWDAALNILVGVEGCWSNISLEKQVFPKLYAVLKDGGRGNGSAIFPNILPLLSKLPSHLIKDKYVFYGKLFENMRSGLEVNSVNQSISEGKIIANTFIECLKYIMMCNCEDIDLCRILISGHLLKAIEDKLSATNMTTKSVTIPLVSQTSRLLRYWHRNRTNENLKYEPMLLFFMDSLYQLFKKQIAQEASEAVVLNILNNQMEFLHILKNPNKHTVKNKGKVKFSEDKSNASEESDKNVETISEPEDSDFSTELMSLVKRVASLYLTKISEERSFVYLPFLNKIISSFDSLIIFKELTMIRNRNSMFELYTELFAEWLDDPDVRGADVVDVSFNLLRHLEKNEKELILRDFNGKWFNDVLQYDVARSSLRYSNDECVRTWLRSEDFAKRIIEITERFVNENGDANSTLEIITMLFKTKCEKKELVIGSKTAGFLMEIVGRNIRRFGDKRRVNELGRDLVLHCSSSENFDRNSFEQLVAALFKLSCCTVDDDELSNACEVGLRSVLDAARRENANLEFTRELTEIVTEIIFSDDVRFHLNHVISKINTWINLAIGCDLKDARRSNSDVEKAVDVIKVFLKDPVRVTTWRDRIAKSCRIGYQARGDWDLKFVEIDEIESKINRADVGIDEMDHVSDRLIRKLNEEYDSSSSLKFMNFSVETLNEILNYRRRYDRRSRFYVEDESTDDREIDVDAIKKFCKWNMFVGSLLNLIVSATSRRREDENVVVVVKRSDEEEESIWNSKANEIPLRDSDFEEKNNIIPICNHFFDLVYSVGILDSFNEFYNSTEYYHVLKEPLTTLKIISEEIFNNANALETFFCYYSIKYFVETEANWRIIVSALKEIFHRKFSEETGEITTDYVSDFVENVVKKKSINANDLLKLWHLIKNHLNLLTEEQWHKIFVHVDAFLDNVKNAAEFSESDLISLSACSRLYLQLIKSFQDNHPTDVDGRISPEICLAWNEVVEEDLRIKFFDIWSKIAAKWFTEKSIRPEYVIIFENLSQAVIAGIDSKKSKVDATDSISLAKQYGLYITSPHAAFQITSFRLLISLVPELVKIDTEMFYNNLSEVSQETKEGSSSLFKKNANCDWACKSLEEIVIHNQGIVEILLSDFIIGDCCTVRPFTDSYSYTYSYLLLWCFLLEMSGEAHSPLRFQYGCWLREKGYSNILLESVFKLMPQTVLHGSEAIENCQKYFENHASLNLTDPVKSDRIEQTACYVYRLFLQRLPNIVREWWSQSENKTSSLVDKVTSLYVSPILISNELKSVQQDREGGFDNMEIKIHANAREVVATYTIDEVKMDLILTLPQNHPLGTIKIESSNVVISTSNWRNWLFHISKYLIHQNGTIWDALVIWKNNLDKKFEGVEECYICFSILQGSTYETPKLCCHTCKKKFHSNCLYKWFSTSNKSTCPICRNLF